MPRYIVKAAGTTVLLTVESSATIQVPSKPGRESEPVCIDFVEDHHISAAEAHAIAADLTEAAVTAEKTAAKARSYLSKTEKAAAKARYHGRQRHNGYIGIRPAQDAEARP